MKKIIVYFKNFQAKKELSEFFQNKGYDAHFATQKNKLLELMSKQDYSTLYLYIHNLSDIRFLRTIRSLYPDLEINLIISPNLQEIIELLQNSDFKIMNEVTQLV